MTQPLFPSTISTPSPSVEFLTIQTTGSKNHQNYSHTGSSCWAAIRQVWTRHCRSSRACPTAFIALSVHHMFVRPLALLVFQTVPGPCLPGWGQSCGSQVLGFTALGHCTHDTESGSCLGGPVLGQGGGVSVHLLVALRHA